MRSRDLARASRDDFLDEESDAELADTLTAEPPLSINRDALTAEGAEIAWIAVSRWVNWLRRA